jgi:uncharacterized protein YndB with AHSA1/START domain
MTRGGAVANAPAPGGTETVEHEVRVAAAPEVVFEYFTDPAKLVRWMGAEATLDPRPGGVCRLEINGSVMLGEFVQVAFPWRIVFTWGWERRLFDVPPQSTAVEVSFTADGEDTLVRLTHCRLPEGALAFHRAGWRNYLARLSVAAAGGDPGPDPWADRAVVGRAIRDGMQD